MGKSVDTVTSLVNFHEAGFVGSGNSCAEGSTSGG